MKVKLLIVIILIVSNIWGQISKEVGKFYYQGSDISENVIKKYCYFDILQQKYLANEAILYIVADKYVARSGPILFNISKVKIADKIINYGRCYFSQDSLFINDKVYLIDYTIYLDNVRTNDFLKVTKKEIDVPNFVILFNSVNYRKFKDDYFDFFSMLKSELRALLTTKGFEVKAVDSIIKKDLGFYNFSEYQKFAVNSGADFILYINPLNISGKPIYSLNINFSIYDSFRRSALSSITVNIDNNSIKANDEVIKEIIKQLCTNSISFGNSTGFFSSFYRNLEYVGGERFYFITNTNLKPSQIAKVLKDLNVKVNIQPEVDNENIHFSIINDIDNFEQEFIDRIYKNYKINIKIKERGRRYTIFTQVNNNLELSNRDVSEEMESSRQADYYKFIDKKTLYIYPTRKYPDYKIPDNLNTRMFEIYDNTNKEYRYFRVEKLDEATIMIILENYLDFVPGRRYYIKFDGRIIIAEYK